MTQSDEEIEKKWAEIERVRNEIRESIWQTWQSCLDLALSCDDDRLMEPIQKLIAVSRENLREVGFDTASQHDFFATLLFHIRKKCGHGPTSPFVLLLQLETEMD